MRHAVMGLATLLGGLVTLSARAQSVDDALLYMRQNPSGTARTLGIGGANVALGADFGNLTSNPAGLGFYTRSEATFTPGLGFGSTDAGQYQAGGTAGGTLPQTANSFHVANAGLVFANRRADNTRDDDGGAWRGGSFALGFTRLADFNQAFQYHTTTNDDHSFLQRLREPYGYPDYTSNGYQQATNYIYQQYANTQKYQTSQYTDLDGLAYGVGLTDQVKVPNPNNPSGDSLYRIATPARNGPITQNEVVKTTGSLSQFDLGYGGSIRDRLYIGVGLGLVSLNRTTNSTFYESSEGTQDYLLTDYLKTTGTGVNARLGLIYRAADAVRLGASIQTPTYIRLTDSYSSTLQNVKFPISNVNSYAETAPGTYEYSITTPFRANGGIAVLLSKYGFLTADAEYVGYKNATFGNAGGYTDDLSGYNQGIRAAYQNTINLRFGAEARLDIFRLRAGFARYGDPYASNPIDRSQNYYSGGAGVRTRSFFVDAAYVYLNSHDLYSPYMLAGGGAPQVSIHNTRGTISVTGGLLF